IFKVVGIPGLELGAAKSNRVHQRLERPRISANRATSSLVCADFGTMIFFVKPSIGRSAALKMWQCASMMRLMRGADCAQLQEGKRCFASRQRDTAREKFTPAHCSPRACWAENRLNCRIVQIH